MRAFWVVFFLLGFASAAVPLGSAITTINDGSAQVKLVAAAIVILLSSLLAIALVVMLYLRTGGSK